MTATQLPDRNALDTPEDHAAKAMKLSQSMRRTRQKAQKARTGHVICHHLRMMLAEELPPVGRARRGREQTGRVPPSQQQGVASKSSNEGQISSSQFWQEP